MLCFRSSSAGRSDVGATSITQEMKLACVRALAELGATPSSRTSSPRRIPARALNFGRDYLIPKPFDPALVVTVPPAVAKAAMESGVATRPIADFDAIRERLAQFVYHSAHP